MATFEQVDSDCPRHGLDRHVQIHEAGHAVAAIDNEIDFRAVVSYDDLTAPRYLEGLAQAAAAIDLGPDPSEWALPNRLASFRFIMAGVAAEMAVLGDSIRDAWREDVNVWRRGIGETGEQTADAIAEYLGKPMMDAWNDCLEWADQNVERIEAVAEALAMQSKPWEVSRAEVEEILAAL